MSKHRRFSFAGFAAVVGVLPLAAGCATNTGNGALIGAGAGAGTGALVGSMTGSAGVGALIGAPVGAAAGAIIGNEVDKKQYEDNYSHGMPPGEGRPGYYQTRPYPEYDQPAATVPVR